MSYINRIGIDVTLNCTVTEHISTYTDVVKMVDLCKSVGASFLVVRNNYNNGLQKNNLEKAFDKFYKNVKSSSCPVCSTNTKIINGIYVGFSYGVLEPSNTVLDYEIILQPTGALTYDYAGLKSVSFEERKSV